MNVAAVTRFVRQVIGCNCPDEVFQRLEVQRGSVAVKSCSADYELRIGNRLLIVITSEPIEVLAGERLEKVISEGRKTRDNNRFNRFRLVVRAHNAVQDKEKLLRLFEAIPGKDEKTHVHVLAKGEVPDFFAETQLPSDRPEASLSR